MEIDLKEEVYKCSKCGLCQSVCPIYLATKNEMYLPRGRYIILNNFFNNGKKLSKKFIKDLDICLNCNLCKDFCPSNIDMEKISCELKSKYQKRLFTFELYFKLILNFKRLFKNNKSYELKNTETKGSVVYFEGCYNRYIDSSDKNATLELIEKLGYKVVKVVSNCCGYPILSDGNYINFEKNAQKIIKDCDFDADYVICSCDSCYATLRKIENAEFQKKLIRLDKFLEINNFIFSENENALYFKPITRTEKTYLPSSVEVINKKGSCSLMENFFALKHKNMAKKIKNNIAFDDNNLKDKMLITTCNLSKWGLSDVFKQKVVSYSEYVLKQKR